MRAAKAKKLGLVDMLVDPLGERLVRDGFTYNVEKIDSIGVL